MSGENGWGEYSKLVLKELETLAKSIEGLRNELQEVKQELAAIRAKEDKVEELKSWKEKVDEVASPTQLKELTTDVQELKLFKTKAVTVFAVVQFIMATVLALSKAL